MLWHALHQIRSLSDELIVAFLRTVSDPRKKKPLIENQPLKGVLLHRFPDGRAIAEDELEIFFGNHPHYCWFERFEGKYARLVHAETLDGGNTFAFEEKLERNVLSIVVEPGAQAAALNEISCFGDFTFPQQDVFRTDFLAPEQVRIRLPFCEICGMLRHASLSR